MNNFLEQISFLEDKDTSYLDEVLLMGPYMKLLPAEYYRNIPFEDLKLWCHHNARYGIPTVELIEWLKEIIGNQQCIEIGAGAGDLGKHLGILQTDSKQQNEPHIKKYMATMGNQTCVKYPSSVRKIDALDAVIKYEPDVVIGSWITQYVGEHDYQGEKEANMWGVKETEIIERIKTYIMIGNENIHGTKKVLALPHETYRFPWLVSRAKGQDKNVIYVWRK